MRMRCKKAILLLALTIACRETNGPATANARFELSNIDGRQLPTYPAVTPGLTPTILSSTVTLYKDGTAAITEHRTEWNGADATSTLTYTYQIAGNQIAFEMSPPCPANALCVAPPKGTILGPLLSLEMGRINTYVIHYNYLLAPND